MSLGGGTFESQNKILPGTYINFVNLSRATKSLSERGYLGVPLDFLKWGDNGVITIKAQDFEKNALKITGYAYDAEENKPFREMFKHAHTIYGYNMHKDSAKASNAYGTAVKGGTRGNDLKTVITINVDDNTKYDVVTYLGTEIVDSQTVGLASELVACDYVIPKTSATLAETSGTPYENGTDGTITAQSHQDALDILESYNFNVLICPTIEDTIKTLYKNYVSRLRDEKGIKFQVVLYNKRVDYEGCINVKNKAKGTGNDYKLIYWTGGAEAGCAVNKSCSNMTYDGEYEIDTDYTQAELEEAMTNGELVFHRMGNEIRILEDINSLTTLTEKKGEDFKYNQTIRVIDQIAMEVATTFNNDFYGKMPNDVDGRISLRDRIVDIHKALVRVRALETFDEKGLEVQEGENKRSVVIPTYKINVINCMSQLYMTVQVA